MALAETIRISTDRGLTFTNVDDLTDAQVSALFGIATESEIADMAARSCTAQPGVSENVLWDASARRRWVESYAGAHEGIRGQSWVTDVGSPQS